MQVTVGRIGRPHGVRGDVVVGVRTDEPELRFAPGSRLDTDPESVGPLTVVQRACRSFDQITHRGMAILSHERDRAVVEHRQDDGAAVMMDHFALVGLLAFAHRVDSDVENAAVEYFLAADDFRKFHVLVSILRSGKATP